MVSYTHLTRSDPTATPHARWPELTRACRRLNPSAIWRLLVDLEPCLKQYDTGGVLDRDDLVMRLTGIVEATRSDRSPPYIDAESARAADYICGVAEDARALIRETAPFSGSPTSSWEWTWDYITSCSVCWQLTIPGDRTGFSDNLKISALCADHRPAAGQAARNSYDKARRRMKRIIAIKPGELQHVPSDIMRQFEKDIDDTLWREIVPNYFPLVSKSHPSASAGAAAAMTALSGLDERIVDRLIADIPSRPQNARLMLFDMLSTRELWLRIEASDFHGGTRQKRTTSKHGS